MYSPLPGSAALRRKPDFACALPPEQDIVRSSSGSSIGLGKSDHLNDPEKNKSCLIIEIRQLFL